MQGTLTIGDFAKATHFSVKTLRHYHDLGLLIPAAVDASSGYRRYASDQIPVALVIRRFRDLDMPLGEIGEVLGTSDPALRSELIAAHLERLESKLAETQQAVASLRGLLRGVPATAPITHRRDSELRVAAITEPVEHSDLGRWFARAMAEIRAALAAQHLTSCGTDGSVVSDAFFAGDSGEITVFVPVPAPLRRVGRVTDRVLPSVELAVIVHDGPHIDIDRTYGALAAHVADHAIATEGSIRERYLVGRDETADESKWRTEIGWPIFRTTSD
ncbi:MAG TPA: MerR family transcriptional regulator [Ilumatobacteraceae bacterium]|jgi:DNA-binding transcriptional MerR regulator